MSLIDVLHHSYQEFSATHTRKFNSGNRYYYRTPEEANTMKVETIDRELLYTTCQDALRDLHQALLPAAAAVIHESTDEVTLFSADSLLSDQEFMVSIPEAHLLQVYNELLRLSSTLTVTALQFEQNPDPKLVQEQTAKVEASNQRLEQLLGISLIELGRVDALSRH